MAMEPDEYEPEVRRNWCRNKELIDLSQPPKDIKEETINQYNLQQNKPTNKLFPYFMKNQLKHLMSNIQDFK